jgi:hypothetical protein
VFIYNQLNKQILQKLKKIAKTLKKKYSSDDLEVNYTFKVGPIKIPSKKPKTLLIHFLVYSKEDYFKYESILTRYSFQHYPPLLGQPLKEINNFKSVVNIDIFNEIDGIPAIKSWINNKKVPYLEPTDKGFKIAELKLSNGLYLEIIFYSVLWLANNILRVFGEYYPDIDKNMCSRFSQKFPIKMREFPLEIYSFKQKIRNNAEITGKEADLNLEAYSPFNFLQHLFRSLSVSGL